MSRGPFQTNIFNGFTSFLVWSRNPEMPASRIHQTSQLCKTFKLSAFCLSLWTIKWSKVRAGGERTGTNTFSCTSNLQSLPWYFTGKKEEVTIHFLPQSCNWSCCPLHELRQSWERTDVITPLEEGEALPQWELPHAGTVSQLLPRSQADGFPIKQWALWASSWEHPGWWLSEQAITSSQLVVPGRHLTHHQ